MATNQEGRVDLNSFLDHKKHKEVNKGQTAVQMSYRIVVHPISPRWKTHWSDGHIMWTISHILLRLDFFYRSFMCFLRFSPRPLDPDWPPVFSLNFCASGWCYACLLQPIILHTCSSSTNQVSIVYHAGSSLQSLSVNQFTSVVTLRPTCALAQCDL